MRPKPALSLQIEFCVSPLPMLLEIHRRHAKANQHWILRQKEERKRGRHLKPLILSIITLKDVGGREEAFFSFLLRIENQSEIDPNENNEGGFSIQSDTNLSSISPPEGFVGLDDSAADEIYSTQSLASQSDRSANIDSFEYMESDFENSVESVSNQFDDEENAYQNPSNMTITERNFSLFEKMIKEELCVKEVPNAIKTKAWNNQVQDRKRALNSRLHQRKRNMHAEVLAFSDVRPIQALRKDVERTARTQQVKREREAQRQTKASLTNQNRRVIKMEQRLADAERDVESILQRRRMREKELSRQLYESYLSSQRSYIGELSRMDRDQRRAKMEAEKIKRESKESYVKDQIRLLEEELKEAKREEELIAKAHAEEMRKLIREQKSKAKDDIQRIKSKLTIDDNDFELQRAAAINAARNMRFGIQNK
ncbi:hypothetical protein BDR26DRAFT_897048 [Obelidium mucronatum]|nr:hypothetical protein BDR26DRAFT_897048 [Obelidium mucronatum]